MILKQGAPLLLVVLVLLTTVAGCARAPAPTPAEVTPAKEGGELKRVVEIEADGLTLHYLRQSLWGEAKFAEISTDKAGVEADFRKHFEERLAKERVSASDYSFSFDGATQSTVIRCDIHDAVSRTGDKYTARFEWLKLPEGFDLLNFDKISEDTLKGETEINGTPVILTLLFPAPINNCHWHVWWSE